MNQRYRFLIAVFLTLAFLVPSLFASAPGDTRRVAGYQGKKIKRYKPPKIKRYKAPKINRKSNKIR